MNASEAAQVLTAAALVDKRTVGEADARMWAEILPGSIGPRLAVHAVKTYYREHREMVMPADVIKYVAAAKRDLEKRGLLDLDAFRDLPSAGHRLIYGREFYEALASGATAESANTTARDAALESSAEVRLAIEPARDPRRLSDYGNGTWERTA